MVAERPEVVARFNRRRLAGPGRHARRDARFAAAACGLFGTLALGAAACAFDWDSYDPRLGTGGTGTAAGGQAGGGATGDGGSSAGGATGAGGGDGGSSAGGGSSGGGGASGGGGPSLCGGPSAIADDFADGELATGWFSSASGGATIDETGGERVVTLPSHSASWAGFSSWRYFDLRGDQASIEVTTMANTATDATVFLHLVRDSENFLVLAQQHGTLYQSAFVDDGWIGVGSRPYDPSLHRYWRIREEDGTVRWEASADGQSFDELSSMAVAALFPVDYLQVEFGAATEGTEPNPGEAHFDELNGGPPPAGAWCPIDSLSDDFEDGERSTFWLRSYDGDGCALGEQGGQLVIAQSGPGPCDCAYFSSRSYDLRGSAASVELPDIEEAGGHVYGFFRLEVDGDNAVEFVVSQGSLFARFETSTGFQTVRSQSYDAAQHRFWRIREQSGTTYWEISADGQAWTAYADRPNPVPPHALDVVLGGGIDDAGSYSGAVSFDNYNRLP